MSNSIKTVCAALSIALVLGTMVGLNIVSAQSPVDYDADDDGLIEIEWLEQLNAIRWDLDGDGVVDDGGNAESYSAAFLGAAERTGCADGCRGYELTRDLDFKNAGSYASGMVNDKWTSGNGWLPIGISGSFYAEFDGNRLTISNLYINRNDANQPEFVGLFGLSSGSISWVGLVDTDVVGGEYAGGLSGDNSGSIVASFVSGSVSGIGRTGGLVGRNSGSITSSYASGSVSGGSAGGLVGSNNWGSIISSYATGRVLGSVYAGGLVGDDYGDITSSYATGSVSGPQDVGGLTGRNIEGNITSSYATGSVSGNRTTGGLAGTNYGDITSSYATGSVSGEGQSGGLGGGLVGINGGSITSSFATGSVSGNVAGGLVGANDGIINYCYAIGRVSGEEYVGGFIGVNEIGKINASYWNTETSGQVSGVSEGSDSGVEGKTTAELQEPTDHTGVYTKWLTDSDNADEDFDDTTGVDDVWDFGTSSQYPELKADLDNSGNASWWEFGPQHGRPQPTATPTPLPTSTPTPTLTPTVTPTSTVTPTPTQTSTPTNTPIPTDTPTATPSPTMTPIPTDTPVPTATATHIAAPTNTTAPTNTPEPTKTPVPTTQMPVVVVVVVTATPAADAPSGGGCNSVGTVPVGAATANLLLLVAPLGIIGGVRYRRRTMESDRFE